MEIIFDSTATENNQLEVRVLEFLDGHGTLELSHDMPIVIFQDGVSGSYYIKCSILAETAATICDLAAKLDVNKKESFRANRELLLDHVTYKKMQSDAAAGREFNDIIVEYNTEYAPEKPLKVWGGQHRIKAILEAGTNQKRYHGFRIYFGLSKGQRNEVALISNMNIAVSNDTFDRMIEETFFGDVLREWCWKVGLLPQSFDFPDTGSRSENITVKLARSLMVNFYLGKEKGKSLKRDQLDKNVYEPYIVQTGTSVDDKYETIMSTKNVLKDKALISAGEKFAVLHNAQRRAFVDKKSKVRNIKAYRNKAMVESILSGWSYIAGLLQAHPSRLKNHYKIPKISRRVPDPLNAEEMSRFKHDSDSLTYRGLGTRSAVKDRQRVAQLFLARSSQPNAEIDRRLMVAAVSTTVGLLALAKGYIKD